MKTTITALALLGSAFGAVLDQRSGDSHGSGGSSGSSISSCYTYTDEYDDLTANVVPLLSPVGTYHGLTYEGFVVVDDNGVTSGVIPQSPPNLAVATLQTDEVQLGSLTLTPFGSITTGPNVKSFNFYSFYFGCADDLHQGEADASEGCTIAVTGFYANGQQVPEATFAFAPTNPLAAPLNLATLPSYYVGLKNVTFGVATAGTLVATTALNIDNLVHCNYS